MEKKIKKIILIALIGSLIMTGLFFVIGCIDVVDSVICVRICFISLTVFVTAILSGIGSEVYSIEKYKEFSIYKLCVNAVWGLTYIIPFSLSGVDLDIILIIERFRILMNYLVIGMILFGWMLVIQPKKRSVQLLRKIALIAIIVVITFCVIITTTTSIMQSNGIIQEKSVLSISLILNVILFFVIALVFIAKHVYSNKEINEASKETEEKAEEKVDAVTESENTNSQN